MLTAGGLLLTLAMHVPAMSGQQTSGLAVFERDGKFGYRDPGGRVVITPQFEVAEEFLPGGIAAVVDPEGWAYINRKGKVILRPFLVDNGPDPFEEGLARFRSGARLGFFDERGRIVIGPQFDFALPFREGMAAVCRGCRERREDEHGVIEGGRWGFIDKKGRSVIRVMFDAAESFTGGTARVRLGGEWFAIDRNGKRTQEQHNPAGSP